MNFPDKQIRASYNDNTVRVYQAYNEIIANTALDAQTFVSPPFKTTRMTWIKPSFLWMMYRSGWVKKDTNQSRILAIDISRKGFEWALENSCISHKPAHLNKGDWEKLNSNSSVKIQWDPERNIYLEKLNYRSIQIGIKDIALNHYVNDWIEKITDITANCAKIYGLVESNEIVEAQKLVPIETPYPLEKSIKQRIII